MEEAQAIALASDFVRSQGLDYASEGLQAVRFQAGWRVYAPVDIDESDPTSFLDMPVDRAVFLVGDSGRIEETSTSIPPRQAHERFMEREAAAGRAQDVADENESIAVLKQRFSQVNTEDPPTISESSVVETTSQEDAGGQHTVNLGDEAPIVANASRLLDPIVQQLAQLGPQGWERFSAVFAFTVSAEVAQLRFWSDGQAGLVPVPQSIAQLVRQQREVAAAMPAGPWWRLLLLLTVTNRSEMTADYDYGDEPFPDDQLLAPEHYRNDLDTYPRARVPVWLAGYVAGPAAQAATPTGPPPRPPLTPTPSAPPLLPETSRPCPTCGRGGQCSPQHMSVSNRTGGHGFTLATPGMKAITGADRPSICCLGTAPSSPVGNGTRRYSKPRTTATNPCPTSTPGRRPGSQTACLTPAITTVSLASASGGRTAIGTAAPPTSPTNSTNPSPRSGPPAARSKR